MPKYTNESTAGAARAASYGRGAETMPKGGGQDTMAESRANRIDPSVRLGDLTGEISGNVPLARQMAKPAAYTPKKGSP